MLNNFRQIAPRFFLLPALFWIFICMSAPVLLDISSEFKLLCALMLGLSCIRPKVSLYIFLFLMPWFGGDQPGSLHTLRFMLLLCSISAGLVLHSSWSLFIDNNIFNIDIKNPVVFSLCVYWLVTAMSLTGVHPNGILWALVRFNPEMSRDFWLTDEGYEIYPWVSFASLSVVIWIFIYLVDRFRFDKGFPLGVLLAMGAGSLMSIIVGLFDYFDLVDLVGIRPVGADVFRFQRLTSMFGNPTWYAQYITLCAPTLIALLLIRLDQSLQIFLMLLIMIVTECCILFVNQRGGWLAYPFTLAVIWFCIYYIRTRESSNPKFLRTAVRSWIKIALTLPLTLIFSLLIVYGVSQSESSTKQHVLGFVERAKTIHNTNDRLAYLEPTIKLLFLHPILGGGVDAFRHQYEMAFMVDGHPCVQEDLITTVQHGSAHNVYFQTLVGKGLVGILSLLGVIFSVFYLAYLGVFSRKRGKLFEVSQYRQILLMSGSAFMLSFAVYGNVGEIFYTPVNYVVFVIFCSVVAYAGAGLAGVYSGFRWCIAVSLTIFLVGHLYLEKYGSLTCL